MSWLRGRVRRSDRGGAVVEMAIVAPILVLFLIGSLQVGLVVVGRAAVSNAAREGARAASIRYECADNHTGTTNCFNNPSTNYTYIKNAVLAKLNGLVQTSSVTVSVVCRVGGSTGAVESCEKGVVTPDEDIVEVTVQWRHIGATPFVADQLHTMVARATIFGRPNLSAFTAEPDTTPPHLLTASILDTNNDGKLDQIQLTFDEDLTQTVSTSPFVLVSPLALGMSVSGATISNRLVTLTLSGAPANTTAPGAMTLTLLASSSGVTDLSGNQASFVAHSLTDQARPLLVSVSTTNCLIGCTVAQIDTGDKMTLTFSEPVVAAANSATITFTDVNRNNCSSANPQNCDTISITNITAGSQSTYGDKYNKTKGSSYSYPATIASSGNTLVVTVGTPCSLITTCVGAVGAGTDDVGGWPFAPATTIADTAGNLIQTSTVPGPTLF